MTTTTDYKQQALDFAAKYGITLKIGANPEYRKYFDEDKQYRYVFKCRLTRGNEKYVFNFGQSIAEGSNDPDMYSVLACLTKYEPGTFDNFCADYGYFPMNSQKDYKNAERTYKAVCKEFEAVSRLFGDILEELAEIS